MDRTTVRWLPLLAVALLLTASIAAFGNLAGITIEETRPAPFDSLTEEEQARAVSIALGDPAVDSSLSSRYEVIGASLRTDKPDMMQAVPPRLADVQLYDYEADKPLWIVVDLDLGLVRETVAVPEGYEPPLTADETLRAGALARAHPDVQARLADHPEALEIGHLWNDGDAPCDANRCLSISFYEPDGLWGFSFLVIVDLSDEVVREIRSPENQEVPA